MSSKIIFDADNVDIEKIMEQIHERVRERGYDEKELAALSGSLVIPSADSPSAAAEAPLSEYVHNTVASCDVKYWWVMPGKGIKTFARKVVRKLSYFYMKHTFDQQNIYNVNSASAISALAREVENLRRENEELKKEVSAIRNYSRGFDYVKFEDAFRGSEEEIRKRQEKYIPYFSGKSDVLDIGCGRGEFLKLLGENGISARGVDLSPENIEMCSGLDVTHGDGIEYLESLPDNSLGGIFCAQVIEHLSTENIIRLFRLAQKKLRDDAVIITETLNPRCLMIYAESMYLDPSHTKPVHPFTVEFIAKQEGFSETEILYMTPTDESYALPLTGDERYDKSAITLNDLIFGNKEYALICRKKV